MQAANVRITMVSSALRPPKNLAAAQNCQDICMDGGLNPYSMQCASGAGAGIFTPHESTFCHKLILERRMDAGRCLRAISAPHIDSKLDTCELKTSEQEILTCLQE